MRAPMRGNTPIVHNGILRDAEGAGPERTPIVVGTEGWFTWLDTAHIFAFDEPAGRFTARKKQRSGTTYWYAFNRRGGHYQEAYLGKPAALAIERLRAVASSLEMRNGGPRPMPLAAVPDVRQERQRPVSRTGFRLLPAKITPPHLQPAQLVRTRCIDRLSSTPQRLLTVLSAPPGYGKTTLLAQWIAASERPAAWVRLDPADDDSAMFWTYVGAALDPLVPGLLETLWPLIEAIRRQPPHAISAAIAAELSRTSAPIVLVLDEYQHISDGNTSIHEAIRYLVEHLPPNVQLVLASRREPPLPLAKLRARGHVLEMRATDLRFTLDEAVEFLTSRLGLPLRDEQAAALYERTEGWIGALRLAALWMREHPETASRVIHALGESRYLVDYLLEEVVQRMPAEMRAFLFRVVLLDRFNAALCDAVTGQSKSQAMLAAMERENLFLIPLDEKRQWYRFHALFASALRYDLREHEPERAPEVYTRASAWCATNDALDAAITYAIAGNDPQRAAALLESCGETLLERGRVSLVLDALAQLPDEVARERPRLSLAYAYALFLKGDRHGFLQRTHRAQEALTRAGPQLDSTERAILQGEMLALRAAAGTVQNQGASEDIILSLERARASLRRDHPLRGFATLLMGINQLIEGDVRMASATLAAGMRAGERQRDVYLLGGSLMLLGLATLLQGQLEGALALCHRAGHLAERFHDADLTAITHLITGMVLYERNDLSTAVSELHQATLGGHFRPVAALVCLPVIAYAYQAQGNPAAANRAIGSAWGEWARLRTRGVFNWVWWGRFIAAHQARLWILQGGARAAASWAFSRARRASAQHVGEEQPPTSVREWEELMLARAYVVNDRTQEALELLEQLGAATQAGGRTARLLEVRVLQALAYEAQGDTAWAMRALRHAVELAAPEGYVRVFLDGGTAIRRLLVLLRDEEWQLTRAGGEARTSALDHLLHAFGSGGPAASGSRQVIPFAGQVVVAAGRRTDVPQRVKSLTGRELEVLSLIAQGASNKTLARALSITQNTVKRHVQSIFTKLGVRSRTQAVARGTELHLLDVEPDTTRRDRMPPHDGQSGSVHTESGRMMEAGDVGADHAPPGDIEARQPQTP